MTRIIAGEAGGRRLRTPPGDRTRPTSDRVREALFSTLVSELGSLAGVAFLDLFAGSGAVGLEARSRGARPVTLVESDRRVGAIARDNARSLGFADVEVSVRGAATFVTGPARTAYGVVFLDPPYALDTTDVEALLAALVEHGWLAPRALVILERSSRSPAPGWPAGLSGLRRREYGETVLWYGLATPPTVEEP
ncbi:MAG: 16S rRNA (guanine(966)-N(2))-methyltransferase RsmD [Nocardioidaceae bacterium]